MIQKTTFKLLVYISVVKKNFKAWYMGAYRFGSAYCKAQNLLLSAMLAFRDFQVSGDMAVSRPEAFLPGSSEHFLHILFNYRSSHLCDFVFPGDIEIICPISKGFEGVAILGQYRGSYMLDVIQINSGQSKMAQVLFRSYLFAAQLVVVRFISPAEEAEDFSVNIILEVSQALQMFQPFIKTFVEAITIVAVVFIPASIMALWVW